MACDLADRTSVKSAKLRLAKQGRPDEITTWIAHHRRYERPPQWESKSSIKAYGGSLVSWWKGLQPEWRGGRWPLKRDKPDDDSWGTLRCAGPNGIFLVVLGIVWWANVLNDKPPKDLVQLVEDVEWVMDAMTKTATGETVNLGKRSHHPTLDKRGNKRARKA